MYNISKTIRITQKYLKKSFIKKWVIYDSSTASEFDIEHSVYLFLKYVNNFEISEEKQLYKAAEKFIYKSENIVTILLEKGIIKNEKKKQQNQNILDELKVKYPLKRLIIELTNVCNLKCIHCYGKFGESKNINFISYDKIKNLKTAMDRLHTSSIALTGGEVFLNEEFEKIALYYLENGFKVTIFSNGYATAKIKDFLEKTKAYKFSMGISLDGDRECHNYVRGNNQSYDKVMETLNLLNEYDNINVTISTAVMRYNYEKLLNVSEQVKIDFPKMQQQYTLMLPNYEGDTESFEVNEFDKVYDILPNAFMIPKITEKAYRCRGGVTGGALSSNGNIKICNAAPDLPQFIMGNIYEKSLEEIWIKPNKETEKYRKEKAKQQPECKKCRNKKKCTTKNCRVYAYGYKKNEELSSPINCYVTERGKV